MSRSSPDLFVQDSDAENSHVEKASARVSIDTEVIQNGKFDDSLPGDSHIGLRASRYLD